MRLQLRQLHDVRGIYVVKGKPDSLPDRMARLEPEAAASFERDLKPHVVVSDMWRSADSSLLAVQEGRGAAAPGYSAHNRGRAIDIKPSVTMQELGFKTKRELDAWMAERGWFCWRGDGRMLREFWHYYYFGIGAEVLYAPCVGGTSCLAHWNGVLAELLRTVDLSNHDVQRALADLKMYRGAIDGLLGPLSKVAIQTFQRAYGLPATGKVDRRTEVTLDFVAASLIVL